MALSGRRVGLIVALAVVALAGLVMLQVWLLRYAIQIKEQTFRNNVMTALGRISQGLATGEAAVLAEQAREHAATGRQLRVMAFVADDGTAYEYTQEDGARSPASTTDEDSDPPPFTIGDGCISYEISSPQHVRLTALSLADQDQITLVDSFHQPGIYRLEVDPGRFHSGGYIWRLQTDSSLRVLRSGSWERDTLIGLSDSSKQRLASDVIELLLAAELAPLRDRLDSVHVDSVIAATLQQSGIDMEYAYGLFSGRADSLLLAQPSRYASELRSSDLKVRLFPQDVFAPPSYLSLHFPEQRTYVWAQILPLIGAEVLFMLIIIACFGYTIRTILKQRRFSRLLVDFINNMTHEFKTPISTVALATEAIERPDILVHKDRVLQFNAMIRAEIGRMRNQTEKILQMATLEEGDIRLARAPVDLHELIRETTAAVTLQVEARGGEIAVTLAARDPLVHGDRLHLANIIHNLLDNAMKYSPEHPTISVRTDDTAGAVEVRIRDCGIGMSADEQKQAFHKYFRVSTGDRHDVKGFGLGLSYVKLMVEAHGGAVTLASRPGEGTTVRFTIPRPSTQSQAP